MIVGTSRPADRAPAVSVVVPTYNRASLVARALDSLSAQTFGDFEVVVVDDGSTDGTADVVAGHALAVRYLPTGNRGPAAARNTGMRAARGRYVAFLDSDDLYYPYKLALQTEWLDRHVDVGMVYTEFSAFDDDGFWDERHLRKYHESGYRYGRNRYDRLFASSEPLTAACDPHNIGSVGEPDGPRAYHGNVFDTCLRETVVFTNSMMFRRELLERVGYQSLRFGYFHDHEFALRLCKAGPVGFLDVPTYKLRYHSGQLTSLRRPDGARVAMKKQQDLLRVLRVHAAADPAYYALHRDAIDAALGRLARAAAIPLMAFGGALRRHRVHYPRRARRYLAYASRHGERVRALMALTYAPEIARRVYFAIADRWASRR